MIKVSIKQQIRALTGTELLLYIQSAERGEPMGWIAKGRYDNPDADRIFYVSGVASESDMGPGKYPIKIESARYPYVTCNLGGNTVILEVAKPDY